MKVYKILGLLFVLWRMRFLNIRLYAIQLPDGTLNLRISLIFILWANWGKNNNNKNNFGTTQVININVVSLKSDVKDLCKYIKSDSQLLIYKITLDYLLKSTE